MESRIEDGKLVIELSLEKPRLSSTGKTLLVASTRGVQRSTSRFKGKTISIVANAFIFPDSAVTERVGKSGTRRHERDEEDDDE